MHTCTSTYVCTHITYTCIYNTHTYVYLHIHKQICVHTCYMNIHHTHIYTTVHTYKYTKMYLPVSVWFTASPTCSSLFCSHNLFNIEDTSISCMLCCDTRNLCTCLVDFCNQTPTNNQLALSFFYHVCLPTHLWRQWQGANKHTLTIASPFFFVFFLCFMPEFFYPILSPYIPFSPFLPFSNTSSIFVYIAIPFIIQLIILDYCLFSL